MLRVFDAPQDASQIDFDADDDPKQLTARLGLGLICDWCWEDETERSRRLGMLVRLLHAEDDTNKAVNGKLSWEEMAVTALALIS